MGVLNSYEEFWLRANREKLALALQSVFECDVCHLPSDDPEWGERADAVIERFVDLPRLGLSDKETM